jgi:hypothetical protein
MSTFGWTEDRTGFLMGDRLYQIDGTMRKVILGRDAAKKAACLPEPTGTLEGWSVPVNAMYNRVGMEPMQYAICHYIASPISVFGDHIYKGIPLALTGSESGKGKTTAVQVALAAYGDPSELTISTWAGTTYKAFCQRMSVLQNIPTCIDEITKIKPDELSDVLYSMANGKNRERLQSSKGKVEFADTLTWSLHSGMTANKHLSHTLALNGANTEAEAVRFIEIQTDVYHTPGLDTGEVSQWLGRIMRNRGKVGEAFVQYLLQHQDTIPSRISQKSLEISAAGEAKNPQYRFYRSNAAMTLVTAEILTELGIIQFDVARLTQWIIDHIERMCEDIQRLNKPSQEVSFNQMLSDLSPRILVTSEYRDPRALNGPEPTKNMYEPAVGRYFLPNKGLDYSGRMYLSKKAYSTWCLQNRVAPDDMLAWAKGNGILISLEEKFAIGRGTVHPPSNVACVVFDINRLDAQADGPKARLTLVKQQTEGPSETAA